MANCKGCGVPITPENDSDAHMIPKALGGRLAPRGIICRTCNGKLNDAADFALIDAFAAWPTLLDIPRQGSNPSKTVETRKGYKARLDADGNLMRTDVVYDVQELPDGAGHQVGFGAGDMKTAVQLLQRAKKQFPQLDVEEAKKHLKAIGLPPDDEIKLGLDFSPRATFGGVITAIWLFLIHKTGRAFMTMDRLLACIDGMQRNGGTFRYFVNGLPGLVGPDIKLGHKIIVRSVPKTGELIAYVEILGLLKIGGVFAEGQKGFALEHIYAHDLLGKRDRSAEFSINPAIFDAQDWENAGLGPKDWQALRNHFRAAQLELSALYYARFAPTPAA
jgi:hypothetical protein